MPIDERLRVADAGLSEALDYRPVATAPRRGPRPASMGIGAGRGILNSRDGSL
jgi:hypothetical protein